MSLCCVPIEHLSFIWPHARGFIASALALDPVGRYRLEDVLSGLLCARFRLWISWDDDRKEIEAAGVTEIIQYPRARELRIWLVGGRNMRRWGRPFAELLEQFARDMGCGVISGHLRRGWIRVAGEGWKESGFSFEKVLSDGR